MTNEQKIGAGTLATVLAILTLLLSSQSLPVIRWAFGEFKNFAGLPLFAPVTMAVIVGAIAPAWLPYALPACWPEHRTKRVTRLMGFGIAFLMVFGQYRSAIGAQYALFAGSGAYMLWTMLAGFVYRVVPAAKPPSMKGEDADAGTT